MKEIKKILILIGIVIAIILSFFIAANPSLLPLTKVALLLLISYRLYIAKKEIQKQINPLCI